MRDMTETEQDSESSGTPAQTVRVPNVSPNAKSGLNHTIIGANALNPPEDDSDEPEGEPDDGGTPEVPEDQEEALAWVKAAEDKDTAKERADLVWAAHGDPGDPDGASDLGIALREAVYGPSDPAATDADET